MSATLAAIGDHLVEGGAIGGLDADAELADIVGGQEILRHDIEQHDAGHEAGDEQPQDGALVRHAPVQGAVIGILQRFEAAFAPAGRRHCAFLAARPCRKRAHSIGVRVTETMPENTMASTMVTANSCSSRPTMPPMKTMGMNTAASDRVMDRMVKPISAEPFSAAS